MRRLLCVAVQGNQTIPGMGGTVAPLPQALEWPVQYCIQR